MTVTKIDQTNWTYDLYKNVDHLGLRFSEKNIENKPCVTFVVSNIVTTGSISNDTFIVSGIKQDVYVKLMAFIASVQNVDFDEYDHKYLDIFIDEKFLELKYTMTKPVISKMPLSDYPTRVPEKSERVLRINL